MRKIAILVVLFGTLATTRPAHADCRGRPCPLIVDLFAYTFGAALAGGYAYGTGYFIYHDAKDETQSLGYGGGELGYNATFGTLLTVAAVDAATEKHYGTMVVTGSLAVIHDTLAVHGMYRVHEEWENPEVGRAPPHTKEWVAGIAYGANTIVWTTGLWDRRTRTYGIFEAGINAPIAAGLGYLAVDAYRDGERGKTLLFGGMTALSSAFVYHGIKTAISPPEAPGLDLLGTDLIPVAVSDGRETAPGLGVSGSW